MKRGGPLTRTTPLRRVSPFRTVTTMTRRKPLQGAVGRVAAKLQERDWTPARAKVAAEGCRMRRDGLCSGPVQAAHTIGRRYDPPHPTRPGARIVLAVHVVGLCEHHHGRYDAHALNLRPHLTEEEWQAAVALVGEGPALRRVMGSAWREAA